MNKPTDEVEVVVTTTGLMIVYLMHNGVRLREFKTLRPLQDWLRRRPAKVVKTTWQ